MIKEQKLTIAGLKNYLNELFLGTMSLAMLIDGNALLKVSMKDPKLNTRGEHVGGIFQFLLQLRKLIVQRNWDYDMYFLMTRIQES